MSAENTSLVGRKVRHRSGMGPEMWCYSEEDTGRRSVPPRYVYCRWFAGGEWKTSGAIGIDELEVVEEINSNLDVKNDLRAAFLERQQAEEEWVYLETLDDVDRNNGVWCEVYEEIENGIFAWRRDNICCFYPIARPCDKNPPSTIRVRKADYVGETGQARKIGTSDRRDYDGTNGMDAFVDSGGYFNLYALDNLYVCDADRLIGMMKANVSWSEVEEMKMTLERKRLVIEGLNTKLAALEGVLKERTEKPTEKVWERRELLEHFNSFGCKFACIFKDDSWWMLDYEAPTWNERGWWKYASNALAIKANVAYEGSDKDSLVTLE